jgi:peptidoglycan/xylan/chitin deacetylase (PgdA/CDA1 family)
MLPLRKLKRLVTSGSVYPKPYREYIRQINPLPYVNEGLFNLTVDLELAWCRARRGDRATTVHSQIQKAKIARNLVEPFLAMQERYDIPATYAIVGHLLLSQRQGSLHELSYADMPEFNPSWSDRGWYDDLDSDSYDEPLFYAADLVGKILHSSVPHEIASHSFSHVDFQDPACDLSIAEAEIKNATILLNKLGKTPVSFTFPNNRPNYLSVLKEFGFKIYRGQDQKLERDALDLWKFPLGLWISPKGYSPTDIIRLAQVAVEKKTLVNLWFHLSEFTGGEKEMERFFFPVFSFLDTARRKEQIKVLTMAGVIDEVIKVGGQAA